MLKVVNRFFGAVLLKNYTKLHYILNRVTGKIIFKTASKKRASEVWSSKKNDINVSWFEF